MTISDEQWQAMTPRERDAVVLDTLFPHRNCPHNPRLASSWPGLGFVVERMRELGFSVVIANDKANWARFLKVLDMWKYAVGEAESDSIPSATALAAVRAMEAEK